MTKLIVFDLDGTLLDTSRVDEECYLAACREEFSFDFSSVDWKSFTNVTDSGIARELLARYALHSPEIESRLEKKFIALLERAARDQPERFRPLPGAEDIIEVLQSRGWAFCIATGGWRSSAAIKLRTAGLAIPDVPLASCDGWETRAQIVRYAIELASAKANSHKREHPVMVGDAPWDVETARQLSLPFVGFGTGERAARLLDCGSAHVVADYSDADGFLAAVESASVPRRTVGRTSLRVQPHRVENTGRRRR